MTRIEKFKFLYKNSKMFSAYIGLISGQIERVEPGDWMGIGCIAEDEEGTLVGDADGRYIWLGGGYIDSIMNDFDIEAIKKRVNGENE